MEFLLLGFFTGLSLILAIGAQNIFVIEQGLKKQFIFTVCFICALSDFLLIFLGIPPAVAVGTEAPHVLASSVSGVVAHWRRKNVDFKMGFFLMIGGVVGSTVGVNLFKILRIFGQIDIVIQMLFLIFLGFIGFSMAFESAKTTITKYRTTSSIRTKLHQHSWIHGLPLKFKYRKSKRN